MANQLTASVGGWMDGDGTTERTDEMEFVVQDEQMQPVSMEREIVPAGVHEMTIKHAEEGPNEYKVTDENPEGLCLKLRLATGNAGHKFVFGDIPKHLGWRAKQLADALGLAPVGGKISLEPESLVGMALTVEVSHYTSKAGKVSAVVKRYVPAQAQQPAKPAAAKSKARTAAARLTSETTDDIPF